MPLSKERTVIYLTKSEKAIMRKRADEIGRSMSDYIAELVMWDNRLQLIEHAREDCLDTKELVNLSLEK